MLRGIMLLVVQRFGTAYRFHPQECTKMSFKKNQHTLRNRGAKSYNVNPRPVVPRNSDSFINTEYSSTRIPR